MSEAEFTDPVSKEKQQHSHLQCFLNRIIKNSLNEAVEKNILLVNEISEDITVNIDEHTWGNIISDMIGTIIRNTHNNFVQLTAKRLNNVVLLHVKTNKPFEISFGKNNLEEIQTIAERSGGCIFINHYSNSGPTIIFSFLNSATPA